LSKEFAADGMRKGPGCENGIRCQDVTEPPQLTTGRKTATSIGGQNRREQSRLEGTGECNEMYWKTFWLVDHEASCMDFQRVTKIMNRALWRGGPPPKRKKELQVEWEPVM
jgi:hypothetical protein